MFTNTRFSPAIARPLSSVVSPQFGFALHMPQIMPPDVKKDLHQHFIDMQVALLGLPPAPNVSNDSDMGRYLDIIV